MFRNEGSGHETAENSPKCPCDFSQIRSGGQVNERNFRDRWQVTYTSRGTFDLPKAVAILDKQGNNHRCYTLQVRGQKEEQHVKSLCEIADCQQQLRRMSR